MFTEQNISGQVFATLEGLMFSYGRTLFNALSQGFLTLLGIFGVLYMVSKVIKSSLIEGKLSLNDIMTTPLLIAGICTVLLSSFSILESWVFKPFYEVAVNLTLQAVKATQGLGHVNSIVDMLNVVEQELHTNVFAVTEAVMKKMNLLYTVPAYIGCLIINAPFMFIWVLFVCLMVDCVFKFVTVFALSPLLIITYPFSATRGIALSGLRILLNAILTMFLAGIAMGFTMAIMKLSKLSPVQNGQVANFDWFYGKSYWALFLVGCISILFHLKVPKIAANVASIDDGAGAVATVAALGSMAMMSTKDMLMQGGKRAIGSGSKSVLAYSGRKINRAYDKLTEPFLNIKNR